MPSRALNFRKYIALSIDKKPYFSAFILGIIAALTLPPTGLFLTPLICFPLILHITYQATKWQNATLIGFIFGLGYFFFGLYWTTASFYLLLRDIVWLFPITIIGIPSTLALLWVPAFVAAYLTRHKPALSIMTFITFLMWGEYIRGNFMFNFPWNLMGYGLYRIPPFLQISSLVGIYGLTYFFIAAATIPVIIWRTKGTTTSTITSYFFVFMLAGIFLFGYLRIQFAPAQHENKTIAVQIIHPNISQIEKLGSLSTEHLLERYILLTNDTSRITAPQTISIWPENSLSLYQNQSLTPLKSLTKNLPDTSYIFTGAERIFPDSNGKANRFNSLIILDHDGNIIADYNKHILAPWGESPPFEKVFGQSLSREFFKNKQFTTAGNGATALTIQRIPTFAPQICYETAYSGFRPHGAKRPEFIVAVSNDNWAEYTTQPYQAFVQTQVRAIEEGLPILRSANKGISAIIDPYGRPLQQLGTDTAGTINGYLPNAIPQTFYARYGDYPFLIFMILSTIILCVMTAFTKMRKTSPKNLIDF